MTKRGMVVRSVVLAGAMGVLGAQAGCALLQPPIAEQMASPGAPSQSQQVSAALDSVAQVLAELKAVRTEAATLPVAPIAPIAPVAPVAAVTPGAVVAVTPAAQPTAVASASTDKETQILALLTTALQQLNTSLQNAPGAAAQQQVAFATGIQTAQSAAVTFGGQYGALIAAGLGIVSVLIQGMTNTSKAHQTAQAVNATAQALAGRLPPAGHAA